MISVAFMICVTAWFCSCHAMNELSVCHISTIVRSVLRHHSSIACSSARQSDKSYMSTVSLKQSTPFPLKNPSTPSGVVCLLGCATCRFACIPLSATESVMSETSTRPAVLIDSISAGARSSRRELQINPMKLLSRAICTASLTDIVVRPLLWIVCVRPEGIGRCPRRARCKGIPDLVMLARCSSLRS